MNQEDFNKRYKYDPQTDRLGEGGFGEVFKTYDTFLDKWVAIKISKVKADFHELRLKNEVELLNKLPAHPNVARYEECYTFKTISGEHDIAVLQYYDAGNLLQVIAKHELTLNQKYYLLSSLLEGIRFIHSQGIIHRDLKPQNVLIVNRDNNYIPKITDFGISKKLNQLKTTQYSNSLIGAGTITYSSPEQLADTTIRKNTDLWSFGIIAFQVLTGETPFNSGSHKTSSELGRQEMMKQINSGKLPDLINQVPLPWKQIIEKCLINDPEKRIKNVESCIDLLRGINPSETSHATKRKNTIEDDETQILSDYTNKTKRVKTKQILRKSIFFGFLGIIIFLIVLFFTRTQNNTSENQFKIVQTDSLGNKNIPEKQPEIIQVIKPEIKPDSVKINLQSKTRENNELEKVKKSQVLTPVESVIDFPNGDKYTGLVYNGKMHGKGRYWFNKGGLISKDDPNERKADAGDYIEGEWKNGDLYKGSIYDKNGVLKSKIILGRN